jgi:predicted RNA-binding protein Jag
MKHFAKVINPDFQLYKMNSGDTVTFTVDEKAKQWYCPIYPFEISYGITADDGNTYIKDTFGHNFLSTDVQELTDEEYAQEVLNLEIKCINDKLTDEVKDWDIDYFMDQLIKAFLSSAEMLGRDQISATQIFKTRNAIIKCLPHRVFYENTNDGFGDTEELLIWIECERPGILIGRGGETIDYLEKLVQAHLAKYMEIKGLPDNRYTVSLRIKEIRPIIRFYPDAKFNL